IEEMLGVLRKIRSIIDDQTTPAYEATQFIDWNHSLAKGDTATLIAKLTAIRDPMRQAHMDLDKLLYDNRHYDLELRPVTGNYSVAFNWMDGALTPLIDNLN